MPYLKQSYTLKGIPVLEGEWVPETNLEGWRERDSNNYHRGAWNKKSSLPPTSGVSSEGQRLKRLKILGGDIGSAQRDGLFYANFVECLKNSLSDTTAGEVVERMETLGFVSVNWPEDGGGPPRRRSPQPCKQVLNWLLGLLAEVGKFLSASDGL